ncbi:MAG: DinB family protein [Bacteroidota bacterium]
MTIKPAVAQIFSQITYLLEGLSNEEYSKAVDVLNGSSIGQHVRHTLEFFKCLFDGLPFGEVNYDKRNRDIFLENNTLQALALLNELNQVLIKIDTDRSIQLCQNYGEERNEKVRVKSNLQRELIYNIEHAVHHMALIRIGVREIKPSLNLSSSFGVASSTVRYQKTHAAHN